MSSINTNRFVYLDVIKGIAIILVILHHGLGTKILPEFIDSFHMPLFIMISGLLSAKYINFTWEKSFKYWSRKILQLLVPMLTIYPIIKYLNGGGECTINTLILSLQGGYKGGYWFILVLFVLLLVQYIMRFIASKIVYVSNNKFISDYAELILISLPIPIFFYLRTIMYEDILNILSFNQISWLYPHFVLGFIIGRYKNIDKLIKNEKLSAILVLMYLIFFNDYVFNVNTMSLKMYPWAIAIVIFIYSSIYNFVSKSKSNFSSKSINLLSNLGQNSLAIYLLHYIFLPNKSMYHLFVSSEYLDLLSKDIFSSIGLEIFCSVLLLFTALLPTYLLVLIIKNNKFLSKILIGDI